MIQLEAGLQINGATKSEVKEVLKKVSENIPKRIGGEKNANDANDRINTINVN